MWLTGIDCIYEAAFTSQDIRLGLGWGLFWEMDRDGSGMGIEAQGTGNA